MNVLHILIMILGLFGTQIQHAFFAYDTAAHQAQKGSWDTAQQHLVQLLVEDPDNAQLLYDNGMAAYNQHDFTTAQAYFSAVPKQDDASKELKVLASIQAGNCAAALKDLDTALARYEDALSFDSDNEYAQHNADVIRALKQEQEDKQQEEQEKQDQSSNGQDNDDNQNKSSGGDQQQNAEQSEGDDGESQQNSSEGGEQDHQRNKKSSDKNNQKNNLPQSQSSGEGSDNHDTQGDDHDASDDGARDATQDLADSNDGGSGKPERAAQNRTSQRGRDRQQPEQGAQEKDQQKRDAKDERQDKMNDAQRKQEHENHNKHKIPSEQQEEATKNKNDRTANAQKKQSEQADAASAQEDTSSGETKDPWIRYVLQQQEEQDKQVNRQMMMRVCKKSGETHEEAANNW